MRQWLTVVGALCLISAIACAEEVNEQHCERNLNAPSDTPLPRGELSPRMTKKSDMVAGEGGDNYFDDQLNYYKLVGVHNFTIWHGNQIDAIQVTYRKADGELFVAEKHGGDGGEKSSYTLSTDEVMVGIEGFTTDVVVDRISFRIANTGTGEIKKIGPFGTTGINPYSLDGLILCFYGRYGTMLDGIGAYYLDIPSEGPVFGGDSGASWQDPVMWNPHPIVGITGITVWSGKSVDAIKIQYELLWGSQYNGDKHGGDGGSASNIYLDPGEVIEEVRMSVGGYINQVKFVTRRQDGSTGEYGPYGEAGDDDTDVKLYGRVIGFHGGEGNVLDALGVYYIQC